MANQTEGSRTLPVLFIDQGDGTVGERVVAVPPLDRSTVSNQGAVNDATTVTLNPGEASCSIRLSGTFVATVQFEVSFDGGSSYDTLVLARGDLGQGLFTAGTAPGWMEGALPAGATHVRARCTAYTSGTVVVRVSTSLAQYEPAITALLTGNANQSNTTRQGLQGAAAAWTDYTTATLAAAGVFTGASVDASNAATGSLVGSSSYPAELRFSAESDVVGTLYVEASRDNTTFRRLYGVTATKFDTTTGFYAETIIKPSWRYYRAVYVNGATIQTRFTLSGYRLALV